MNGGKIMVLGLRKKDWPDLRTQTSRLICVSSDFEALRRQQKAGVPKGVEAVVMTKFVSHSNTRFLDEAKREGVRVYPVMGTGEARKLVIELLHGIRVREALQSQKQAPLPPPLLVANGGTVAIKRADPVAVANNLPPLDVVLAANAKEETMPTGQGPTKATFMPGLGREKSPLRLWVDGQVTGEGTLRAEARRLIDAGVTAGVVPGDYTEGAMMNMVARARRQKGLGTPGKPLGPRASKAKGSGKAVPLHAKLALAAHTLRTLADDLAGLESVVRDLEAQSEVVKEIAKLKRLLK